MHAEKNRGADQSAQLNSCSALLFFSKSNHRFHSLSQDLYNASYIKRCKNNNAFAVDIQCLRSNCGSVVLGCCNIDLALLVVPGQVRPICLALSISFIHESSFVIDTRSFSQLICTG